VELSMRQRFPLANSVARKPWMLFAYLWPSALQCASGWRGTWRKWVATH